MCTVDIEQENYNNVSTNLVVRFVYIYINMSQVRLSINHCCFIFRLFGLQFTAT